MGLFASESSSIEKAVRNATDESLLQEDWSKIIKVCDDVSANPGKLGPEAVKAVRARLLVMNGNVQLYSLTLLNALAQNCGPILQREIASHATASALQRLGLSSSTHRTVLVRLLDILDQLTEQFAYDASLGQISQVLKTVIRSRPELGPQKSSKPTPTSKSAPVVSEEDEDEDLKRALELSLKESQAQKPPVPAVNPSQHLVKAIYDFQASEQGELSFKTGDVIEVLGKVYNEWYNGILGSQEGIFPVNYVEDYKVSDAPQVENSPPPTQAPVVINEEYVFSHAQDVDKLLSLLGSESGQSVISREDVQSLYHQTAAMRPRLVQLIDEYAAKKQELVLLNQKLQQARQSYNKLMQPQMQMQPQVPQAQPQINSVTPMPMPNYAPAQEQPSYDAPAPSLYSPQYAQYAPTPAPAPNGHAQGVHPPPVHDAGQTGTSEAPLGSYGGSTGFNGATRLPPTNLPHVPPSVPNTAVPSVPTTPSVPHTPYNAPPPPPNAQYNQYSPYSQPYQQTQYSQFPPTQPNYPS